MIRALLEEDGRVGIWDGDEWLFSLSTRDEKIVSEAQEAFNRGRRIGEDRLAKIEGEYEIFGAELIGALGLDREAMDREGVNPGNVILEEVRRLAGEPRRIKEELYRDVVALTETFLDSSHPAYAESVQAVRVASLSAIIPIICADKEP